MNSKLETLTLKLLVLKNYLALVLTLNLSLVHIDDLLLVLKASPKLNAILSVIVYTSKRRILIDVLLKAQFLVNVPCFFCVAIDL